MPEDSDYYLEYAARVEATSPALAELLRKRAAAPGESVVRAGEAGVSPSPGTANVRQPSAPLHAYRAQVIPSPDRATGPMGRERDIRSELWGFQDKLSDVEQGLVDYYMIQDGMAPDAARERAQEDIKQKVMSRRYNVEGRPEYGGMEGWLPMTRESRIITRRIQDPETGEIKETDLYYDPDTKDLRPPTASEYAIEAFAKQELMGPEKIGKLMHQLRQQVSDITRQLNYDIGSPEDQAAFDEKYREIVTETFDDWFMYTKPGTAKTIETFTGAALRSWPAITSTIVNTALMGGIAGFSPLFWEQDENGQPVDPDSWAYRAHEALVEAGQAGGLSEEQARDALQGGVSPPVSFNLYNPLGTKFWDTLDEGATGLLGETAGGAASGLAKFMLSPPEISVPIPFQPVKRTQATTVDPYGQRVASASGNFIIDVAQNLRRGRSMGDEFMSIPALAQDRSDDFYRAREGYKESAAAGKNTIYEYVGTTSPYWYGVGMEMFYGIGPFASIAKLARASEKGLQKAAKIANMEGGTLEKMGFVMAHPIEAAARAKTLRAVGDLLEGKVVSDDPLDILKEANNVRRVAGVYGSTEISTPYLMQVQLNVGAPGKTVKELARGTESGGYVLNKVDIPIPDGALDSGQVAAVQKSIYQWIASAYEPGVKTILNTPRSDAEKFKRIEEFFAEAGANQKVFPTLKNPDNLPLDAWVRTLFPDDVSNVKAALPIQPGKPVLLKIHKLGADIVAASRRDEWGQLTGELGRIVQRRIGDNKVGPAFLRSRPGQIAEAVRAAGGRAIEATIENIVPDDYVFVTRTLIAPRDLLTKDVYKRVAEGMKDIRAAFTLKVTDQTLDGRKVVDVTVPEELRVGVRKKIRETFGASNIQRSRDLTRILKDIQEGTPISLNDKAYLLDGIETEVFRDALRFEQAQGSKYSKARTALGGEQAERAMVEGVNIGLRAAPEKRVARRGIADFARRTLPMVISEGGGRQIMSAVRKALRAAGARVEEPPPIVYEKMTHLPIQRMIEELKNRVGSISDNFQREIRDAVIDGRAATPPKSPEIAFNELLARRLSNDASQAIRDVDHEAERLMSLGLEENDAYYRVAYSQGETEVGIAVGAMSGQPEGFKRLAQEQAQANVHENAWKEVLSLYFDRADFEEIQSALADMILSPGATRAGQMKADDYLDLTVLNVKNVIGKLRETHQGLEDAGAAVNFLGLPTSLNQDAIAQVLTAWAVARDRSRITTQLLETLRARHPEVWVDLIPSAYSTNPDMMKLETMLSLKNRTTLYETLIESVSPAAQRGWRDSVASSGLLTPGPVTRKGLVSFQEGGKGTRSREFDELSEMMYSSLTPAARGDLVDKVLEEILKGGTVDLSFDKLLQDVDVIRPFQKNAIIEGLEKVFRGIEIQILTPITSRGQLGDDDILVRLYLEARNDALRAGKTPDEAMGSLVSKLYIKLTRNAFYTVIAPAVREVLSNARAMGFTPGKGPQSLNNVVHEAASIDPYQPSLLMMGDDYRKALEKLKGAARDGRLIENLEMLRQRDRLRRVRKGERELRGENAWEFAKHLVLDVVYSTRTMAASGLLAGGFYTRGPWTIPIPAPNLRYIGMNLLTAPLIALTTVGAAGALKAARGVGWGAQARDVARQVSGLVGGKLVDAVSPRAADDVVFTTVTGRKWTWAELQDAMDRNNIMITRGSVEFQESWMRDVLRDARLTSEGMPAGKFRHFLRTVDPLRTNIFQYIANATDRAFRQNMFASALKEGMTEHQAAQLGRAVVLDYGRLPVGVRSTLNRVFLFIAFRASMTVELVEALARDAPTFNRQLLAMRDSQQASTQYMFGPDYAKARLVIDPTEYVFDGTAGAVNYGPTHPAVDAFFDLARMGQWAFHAFQEDIPYGQIAAQGLAEENLHPVMTAAIESWVTSSLRETDKGWKVPDVWTAWAVQNGPATVWPWMKERYNLRAVMRKRDRTPGRPTVRGSTDDAFAEWYFTDVSDMRKFKRDLMLATYMGFKRTTEDVSKGLMAFYDSDYIDEKRRGNVPAFAFWSGLLTPIGARGPEQIMSQALFEQKRAAQELQPKMERW